MSEAEKLLVMDGIMNVLLAEICWLKTGTLGNFQKFNNSIDALRETFERGDNYDSSIVLEQCGDVDSVRTYVVKMRDTIMGRGECSTETSISLNVLPVIEDEELNVRGMCVERYKMFVKGSVK